MCVCVWVEGGTDKGYDHKSPDQVEQRKLSIKKLKGAKIVANITKWVLFLSKHYTYF